MTIKEAINLLQIDYGMFPDDGEHYKKGIDALKRQLEVDLTEVYPYNLALDIFGNQWVEAREKALTLSVQGIKSEVAELTEREKKILELRYKNKLTYGEISEIMGVTRERIRQILAKALRKLRHPSKLAKMKAYSYHDLVKRSRDYNDLETRNKELEKAILLYTTYKLNDEKLKDITKKIDVVSIPLEELGLSVMAYNSLKRRGTGTLGDIAQMTMADLENVRNLGRKTRDEVLKKIGEYGLKLKGE